LGENGGNSKFVIIIGFSGQMVGGKTRMEKNKKIKYCNTGRLFELDGRAAQKLSKCCSFL